MAVKNEHLQSLISFLQRKGYVWGPEPEIYGGTAGFYTYAPLGKLLKNNVENSIRKTLQEKDFFEVECPIIMERKVWEASGHLGGFTDLMITCSKCKAHLRMDHLIGENTQNRQPVQPSEILKFIKEKSIKCTACNGELSSVVTKHDLMMRTTVGLGLEAYNRPETATTTYLPYLRYTDFFRKSPVFGVFQIGKAFRNEISPRQHIIRMREFTQAEAQLFIKKEVKNNFSKFESVKGELLPLLDYASQEKQEPASMTSLSEALQAGTLKNQAYAWCLSVAYNIFKDLGIPEDKIRFRQHYPDERAFYADDAWDVEVNTASFGWVEVCGVHDRTGYDLAQHSKHSGTLLEAYDETSKEKYTHHILEIAFGSDRPVFAILDAFYDEKEKNEGKTIFKLPYRMSPIPVAVFPLMKKPELTSVAIKIHEQLKESFVCTYDDSGAIGRRYLRAAEAGTAYCVTIDYETLQGEETVTVRDRDSEKQKRVPTKGLSETIKKLLSGAVKLDEL